MICRGFTCLYCRGIMSSRGIWNKEKTCRSQCLDFTWTVVRFHPTTVCRGPMRNGLSFVAIIFGPRGHNVWSKEQELALTRVSDHLIHVPMSFLSCLHTTLRSPRHLYPNPGFFSPPRSGKFGNFSPRWPPGSESIITSRLQATRLPTLTKNLGAIGQTIA